MDTTSDPTTILFFLFQFIQILDTHWNLHDRISWSNFISTEIKFITVAKWIWKALLWQIQISNTSSSLS